MIRYVIWAVSIAIGLTVGTFLGVGWKYRLYRESFILVFLLGLIRTGKNPRKHNSR